MSTHKPLLLLLAVLFGLLASAPAGIPAPDEGMWPFHDLPLETLKEKYGFEPTKEWLDNLRMASVKISSGGSGSFVSQNGLVATNHHVALEFINKLSSKESDLVESGFLAKSHEQELKCPDASLKQLISVENVTKKVASAGSGGDPADAAAARNTAMQAMQKEESQRTGLECEVITMHGGAQFWMYRYKVYDDVRLVFAPEKQIAYFGGDRDNFCYPRFCLDCSFLRAYENGKPARTPDYIRWSPKGVSSGDLIFISGNPASTGRYDTMGELTFKRDASYPSILQLLRDRERALSEYAKLGEDQKLEVLDEVFGLRNSEKAYTGMLKSLRDSSIWGQLSANEREFKKALGEDPATIKAYDTISQASETMAKAYPTLLATGINGKLFAFTGRVLQTVMMNSGQEGEAVDAAVKDLASTKFDTVQETLRIRGSLETALAVLGEEHEFVKAALAGRTPAEAAAALVKEQKLTDESFLRELIKSGREGLRGTKEPLLALSLMRERLRARLGPAFGRAQAAIDAAHPVIARARFKLEGTGIYPDATFTLRLSFGVVKGYELGTTDVPWKTNLWGLYARNSSFGDEFPYNLPKRWKEARPRVDLDTPVDFVSTADTTGGNSGSPVVDRKGHLVGLLFDGNIQSLLVDNLYEEKVCRSVCVDSRFIAHALDKVYGAKELLGELTAQ